MITLATIGTWLASPVVGFFAKMLLDWIGQRRAQNMADENAKQAGANSATSQINKASADAQDRANQVAVNRPAAKSVADDMADGKPF